MEAAHSMPMASPIAGITKKAAAQMKKGYLRAKCSELNGRNLHKPGGDVYPSLLARHGIVELCSRWTGTGVGLTPQEQPWGDF